MESHVYHDINSRRLYLSAGICLAMILSAAIDLNTGASSIPLASMGEALLAGPDGHTLHSMIVWNIRLPMTLTCIFVGLALGIAGLQVQTTTHNPLASPYTLGITASASFGAATAITIGFTIAGYLWIGTTLLALIFAMIASMGIFFLGRLRGMTADTLVFAGIITNFFFSALQQYLQYRASAEVAQIISSWTFGNLARSTWTSVIVVAVVTVVSFFFLARWAWKLTILTIGEERAVSLGINVQKLRLYTFIICSFLIAAAVGFIGTVAFVGLVAPHCARLMLGEDQRYLLPMSGVTGSLLILISSIISKLLSVGAMLPVGIITSVVGVPFLGFLLIKNRRK